MCRSTALMRVSAACVALCIVGCTPPPEDVESKRATEATLLPMPEFAEGWRSDGTVDTYTRDTLYERIDGEAELYMPYGFSVATFTTYRNGDNSVEAAVYEMGSLLDAFGVFSNYRYADEPVPPFGSDGNYSDRQLMFYQDKYFVRLNSSGEWDTRQETLLACGKAIADRLPQPAKQPAELDMFRFDAVEPRTEIYHAESVLGYAFFPKGFVANATVDDESARVFLIMADTEQGADASMQQYLGYLKENGVEPARITAAAGECMSVQDPLHKGTIVCQTGPYILGTTGLSDPAKGIALVDQMHARLPAGS